MSAIALIAVDEFTRRRQALRHAARQGLRPAAECESKAWAWLAIAAAAGADLPELMVDCIWPAGARGRLRADEIMPRERYLAELARARDAAVAKALANPANRELSMRGFCLSSLALNLGAPAPRLPERTPA